MKKALIVALCAAQIIFLAGSQNVNIKVVAPVTKEQAIDLNNDGKDEKIKIDGNKVSINTSDSKMLLEVSTDGTNTSVTYAKDTKLGDTKVIIEKRTRNTAGELSYSILKYDGNTMKEIASKQDIYKGKLEAREDGSIVEEKPVYAENDCNAIPSKVEKTYYKIEADKLLSYNTETVPYTYSSYGTDGQTYTNPSADYINTLLEKAGKEFGIPSAILKGIAWQESSWRQFDNKTGGPLIGYDGIGIGLMQVSDYDSKDTSVANQMYIKRLKYDIEFNISEGCKILMDKWALQTAGAQWKIPKIGDGSPLFLEHWYYALWAYNSYSDINNPAINYSKAYQTLVINHINTRYSTAMLDLYVSNKDLFPSQGVPRTDIGEISGIHKGDVKAKAPGGKYIALTNVTLRDDNMSSIGSLNTGDVFEIKGQPRIYNTYIRYPVEANGKSGWVAGNYIKSIGDVNNDDIVDIYDLTKLSEKLGQTGTTINVDNVADIADMDLNLDSVVDLQDLALLARNYNFKMFTDSIN